LIATVITISAGPGSHGGPAAPVLVELFTSEGCSSCPPADVLLERLADTSDVIPLGEHVDYWDHQGWKDRFSSAAFTARQQVYAARFNIDSIYTPQMVVDGRSELVGSDARAAARAIERARTAPHGSISIEAPVSGAANGAAVRVFVTASNLPPVSRGDHADVVLAITEDRLSSDVKRGENRGRVLTHAAVVRLLTTIGEATAALASARGEVQLASDWNREHLNIVAFVQERRSRRIVAAGTTPLVRRVAVEEREAWKRRKDANAQQICAACAASAVFTRSRP
jgi:hypothetical protein